MKKMIPCLVMKKSFENKGPPLYAHEEGPPEDSLEEEAPQ